MCKRLGPVWVRRSKYPLLLLLIYYYPFYCHDFRSVTRKKMTDRSAKFEINLAFLLMYEHLKIILSKCTVLKVDLLWDIRYTVCRRSCVHFSTRKFYGVGKGLTDSDEEIDALLLRMTLQRTRRDYTTTRVHYATNFTEAAVEFPRL